MQYTNIISTTVNGVNTILINRPKKLNALNSDTINELQMPCLGQMKIKISKS